MTKSSLRERNWRMSLEVFAPSTVDEVAAWNFGEIRTLSEQFRTVCSLAVASGGGSDVA